MTFSVAVIGVGGKMGFRVTKKLVDAGHDVRAVETASAKQSRLAEAGINAVQLKDALKGGRGVVLTVPDSAIGKVAGEIVPKLAAGWLSFSTRLRLSPTPCPRTGRI
jgi:3-hydroxyisobutyrate dehydrogenase-like beta-hydroxyacid dehydrogenase